MEEEFDPVNCENYTWEQLVGFHSKFGLRPSRRDTVETMCVRLLEHINRTLKKKNNKRGRELYELPQGAQTTSRDIQDATKQIRINLATQLAYDMSKTARNERLALAEALLNDRFDAEKCDFDYINDKSWVSMEKNSASDTSIIFGEFDSPVNKEVSIKVSLEPDDLQDDNSLVMEQINYKVVVNSLIENNFTPHLISYIGSFVCNGRQLKKNLPSKVYKHIVDDLFEDTKKASAQQKYFFLLTEKAQNAKKLHAWLWEKKDGEEYPKSVPSLLQIKSVLFQILYNFAVFNRIGFRHNDAHTGNIFVEDSVSSKTAYVLDNDVYVFPTKDSFTKMYDFDRSALDCNFNTQNEEVNDILDNYDEQSRKYADTDICENTMLNSIKNLGVGWRKNERYDTSLTFLFIYWDMKKEVNRYDGVSGVPQHVREYLDIWEQQILPFIEKHMKNVIAISAEGDADYKAGDPDGYKPNYWIPGDLQMSTPLEMIRDSFFDVGKQKETWGNFFGRQVTGIDSRRDMTLIYPTYTLPSL